MKKIIGPIEAAALLANPGEGIEEALERVEKAKEVVWVGDPKECDVCYGPLDGQFVDGATRMGPWGCLCLACHAKVGVGLGKGKGQKYRLTGGRWVKVEG